MIEEMIAKRSYWEIVADKLRHEPSLLQIPRDNIVRWRAQGQSAPSRLDQWEQRLIDAQTSQEGFHRLIAVLLGTEDESERLRDFSAFPGVLTREERRQARGLCGYRH